MKAVLVELHTQLVLKKQWNDTQQKQLETIRTKFSEYYMASVEEFKPRDECAWLEEKFLQKTKVAFTDPQTKRNLDQLGSELKDVRSIMSANIQDVLNRGEKLNKAAEDSHRLVEDSRLYKKSATSLNRCLWLRQMAPAGFVLAIVGGFFYLFYFR